MAPPRTTNDKPQHTISTTVWVELGLMSVMWGSAFLLMKVAVPTVPAFTMTATRGLLAAAILWIAIRTTRRARQRSKDPWVHAVVLGTVSGWLPNVLTAWALLRLDSSVAGMLSAASPIFVVILGHFLLKNERIHGKQGIGIIVGFVGVALIIGVTPSSFGAADLAGQLAMIGVSFSYATGAIYARRIGPQDAPRLAMRQQVVSGSVALLVAIALERPWSVEPDAIAVIAIIGLAVWASAIPIWIYFRMLGHTKAITVSLVAYLIPAVAVVLGALVLDETLEPTAAVGLAVVLAGVYLATRPQGTRTDPPVSTGGIEPDLTSDRSQPESRSGPSVDAHEPGQGMAD
jgi:drug/metabolite transporter (DMT)-like permease